MSNGLSNKMDGLAQQMNNKMDGNTNKMEEMRGEMQNMGRGLQAGIMALACDETRTAGEKSETPRAGPNELGGVQRLSGPR